GVLLRGEEATVQTLEPAIHSLVDFAEPPPEALLDVVESPLDQCTAAAREHDYGCAERDREDDDEGDDHHRSPRTLAALSDGTGKRGRPEPPPGSLALGDLAGGRRLVRLGRSSRRLVL